MARARAPWLRRSATFVTLLYAALVLGWVIAHRAVGDGFWLLALANAFAVYLFAPLPLVAVLAAVARQRKAWIALFVVAVLLVGLFGDELLPPLTIAHAGSEAASMTVMTYNVLFTTTDPAPAGASVVRADPDLVAFQELTPSLAQALGQEIGPSYPYRTPLHPGACRAEVALWSKHPLRVETVDDDILCRVRPVVLDFDGQSVRVVNVHAWPYIEINREGVEQGLRWRREQIAMVLDSVSGRPEPLVLLGDLNAAPMNDVYQMLTAELVDAFREAGWGLGHTFPTTGGRFRGIPYPDRLVRIDYVFHSAHWAAEAAWVGEWDGVSDHRPVVAQLRLLRAD